MVKEMPFSINTFETDPSCLVILIKTYLILLLHFNLLLACLLLEVYYTT
jgi:hypothetical protein